MQKLAIAATALLAGTAALAQTAPVAPAPSAPGAHPMHDRVTTRAEAVAMVREHFAKLDADKDGAISTAEVTESHAVLAERLKGFEGKGPHAFKVEQRDPNAAFDRLDSNKDGSISRDEFAKAREERIEKRIVIREDRKEGAKDRKDRRRHVTRMHGRGFSGRMIVMADSDKDGKITLAEAEALALQHFDQMDSNKDGQVTPEERRQQRRILIEKHRAPKAG